MWIVSGLWGGYTASNVLKWYWWRFNGYGYFWGMVTGIGVGAGLPSIVKQCRLCSDLLATYSINMEVSFIFPLVVGISLIGCLVGTLLTKPEDDAVLMDFYRRVRPWGFWGPVLRKVLARGSRRSSATTTSSATCSILLWASLADRAGGAAVLYRDPRVHARRIAVGSIW